MNILFLGGGNMGAAIASGVLTKLTDMKITVVDPDVERAQSLLPVRDVTFLPDVSSLKGSQFDMSVIAIKPQQFSSLSTNAVDLISKGVAVSIMAGVDVDTMTQKLGSSRIIRTMPNLPALVGQAMTVAFAEETIASDDRSKVEAVFNCVGDFAWLSDEDQIDAVTAVAGSGPGYVFAFAHHMLMAAMALGLNEELADRLVRQTLLGASTLLKSDQRSSLALKEAVTSKAGTTEAGLAIFEAEGGLADLCQRAVDAAHNRAVELSKV
ncbi:pyrroline-5-carboxylate reductase [Paracoccus sp. 22332]|uniref:pyrroline-5-carboxylate reductase n=1 Tax=Paracoccus sp. 22332 TaxID=3453913 RepID=UPI003F82B654